MSMVGNALLWMAVLGSAAILGIDPERGHRFLRRALGLVAMLLVSAIGVLTAAILRQDYGVAYVAQQSRADSSTAYRLAALWSGAEGSLLLFSCMLAVAMAVAVWRVQLARAAWLVVGLTLGLLAATTALVANPFATVAIPAIQGAGLTPILEHPAMIYHPPILYAGLVATVAPFLFVIGGHDDLRRARRWALGAFVLLTVGLATGANWAYVELGWGGYWAWDPVENTVLIPWLVVTASLHAWRLPLSGPMLRGLMAAPFALVAFGAAVTRSGGLSSVHVFADAQSIGLALGLLVAVLVAALIWHLRTWVPDKHETPVAPPAASRMPALALSIMLILFLAVVVLLGVVFPLVPGNDRVLDSSYYTSIGAPLLVAGLIGLAMATSETVRPARADVVRACVGAVAGLGVAALAGAGGWFAVGSGAALGAAIASHLRRPQMATTRLPMTAAHLGMIVLSIGIVGSSQATTSRVALVPGETIEVGDYRVTYESFAVSDGPRVGSEQSVATVYVGPGGFAMRPGLVSYPERAVVLAETALHSAPFRDVQVVLRTIAKDGSASFDLAVRPGVMLVWWGSVMIAFAGIAGLALSRRPNASRRQPMSVGAVSLAPLASE